MSNLAPDDSGPAAFTQALLAALGGEAPPPTVRVDGVPLLEAGTSWDAALLRRVEAVLAARVGPIAAVLVRRVAPGCDTLAALCTQLAEQVSRPPPRATCRSAPVDGGPGTIPESLVEASAGVLARSLGPIAWIVARRAARHAPDRLAYFGCLEAALPDPRQRQAMRAQLDRLQ